ncbi:MAG: hypothetical protein ACRC1D_06070 [Culicoidibacterales bacterium]
MYHDEYFYPAQLQINAKPAQDEVFKQKMCYNKHGIRGDLDDES